MRITNSTLQLAGKLASKLELFSQYTPTALSLKKLAAFGANGSQQESFNFLRYEIPIRLANIMREIHLLPDCLFKTSAVQNVIDLYEHSFDEILSFEKQNTADYSIVTNFSEKLSNIRASHSNVVELMATGVNDMKENTQYNPLLNHQIQYFLDRFYMSKISIQMLINQHVSLFGSQLNCHNDVMGVIDPNCETLSILTDAYSNASILCRQHFASSPACRITLSHYNLPQSEFVLNDANVSNDENDLNASSLASSRQWVWLGAHLRLVYVTEHLYYILFEILKNAMRAVIENSQEMTNSDNNNNNNNDDGNENHKLHILVHGGREDIMIKISDRGSGIPHSHMSQVFHYTYTTASTSSSDNNNNNSMKNERVPLAGYGCGLPLSRLYAKYFQGDLKLSSVHGHGTDVFIYLKRNPAEAGELLPIFNHTSASYYGLNHFTTDWSDARQVL